VVLRLRVAPRFGQSRPPGGADAGGGGFGGGDRRSARPGRCV